MCLGALILTTLECGNPIADDTKVLFFYIDGAIVKMGEKNRRLLSERTKQ